MESSQGLTAFEFENGFLWSSPPDRLAKWIGHWEIWKRIVGVPGDVVEIGVHKGSSLIRWLTFREMCGGYLSRSVVGFDVFNAFPGSSEVADAPFVDRFVSEAGEALRKDELLAILKEKGISKNVTLVKGDVLETIPQWTERNPDKRISLLHIDVDTYEPTKVALAKLAPLVSPGGMILLDDYGKFPGETKAWDEYVSNSGNWVLRKSEFHAYMSYARRPHDREG